MEFKKAASAICALALVAGMAAAPAADGAFRKASPVVVASAETYGGFVYNLMGDYEGFTNDDVAIESYEGNDSVVTIPQTINGKTVRYIEMDCFYCKSSVKKVVLPNTLVVINDSAFENSGITEMLIPASVSQIGKGVFADCNSLTNLEVDSNNNYFVVNDGILYSKDKSFDRLGNTAHTAANDGRFYP